MLGDRGMASITTFPRQLPRVSFEIAKTLQAGQACHPQDNVAVYGTVFTRINDIGQSRSEGSPFLPRICSRTLVDCLGPPMLLWGTKLPTGDLAVR